MRNWLLVVLALGACNPSDRCDPGYTVDHAACVPNRPMNADDGDAGPKRFNDDYTDFGLSCATSADCGGAAPFCAAPNLPVCTQLDCLGNGKICPPDWLCMDVSAFSPDPRVSSLCIDL